MKYFKYFSILALVGAVALVAAPADAPVGIAYVYSDSMEPTIETGDGYVVVPAGTVERGDVVTFWSDHRGEYVTHRVVGTTDGGFVTRGDNNPSTDQRTGHPPVERGAIVGEVFSVGGSPVTVPALGTLVETTAAHRAPVVGLLGLLLLVRIGRSGAARPARPVTDGAALVHLLLGAGVLAGAAVVLLTASAIPVTVAETTAGAPPDAIVPDADGTATVDFTVDDVPFAHRVVSATGATVVGQRTDGETLSLTLAVEERAGSATVRFHHYPAAMPRWALERIHAVHPVAAALSAVSLAFAPFSLLWLALSAGGAPVRAPRWRSPNWLRGRR